MKRFSKEELVKNDKLKDLTPEQFAALESIAKLFEDEIYDGATKKIYKQLDDDIFEATGERKDDPTKSYNFMKEKLKGMASTITTLQNDKKTFEDKISDLETKIKEGKGDEALQTKVKELTDKLKENNDKLETLKNHHKTELEKVTKERDSLVTSIDKGIIRENFHGNFTRKKDFDEDIFNSVQNMAMERVLSKYEPEIIDREKNQIRWKNKETGKIEYDPNTLNAKTGADLLLEDASFSKVIEAGQKQPGTGGPGAGGGVEKKVAKISDAKTRVQADTLIRKQAHEAGLKQGTEEYDTYIRDSWAANKVDSLPYTEPVEG